MTEELEQNDPLHKYSICHVGEKMGEGAMEGFDIFYAEDDDKSFHVVGNGIRWDGVDYDYFQMWIPKSIAGVRFDIFGYKSTVWFPVWATVKIYNINKDKAERYAEVSEKLRHEAEMKRNYGGEE